MQSSLDDRHPAGFEPNSQTGELEMQAMSASEMSVFSPLTSNLPQKVKQGKN
jgi:hypothetical protein